MLALKRGAGVTINPKRGPDKNDYRSNTVNSKSFVGAFLLRIKRKYELNYVL